MAPRRTYRSVKVINNNVYDNLTLNDVLCPICRSILVEPVSLPCSHGFCFSCFEGTMANASLTCPLCRIRFGSWHRVAKKENRVVNANLWLAIKKSFPQQVQNKLDGHEDNLQEETPIRLATAGDIRREYEEQKKKEQLEVQKQRIAEAKASEELIKKIREQEEYEETILEEKLRFNEQAARKFAQQMGYEAAENSCIKSEALPKKRRPLDKFLHNVKHNNLNVVIEPIGENCVPKKDFVTKIMCQGSKKLSQYFVNKTNDSKGGDLKSGSALRKVVVATEVSDSNDSIENECRFFKPIDLKNIPPPKCIPIVKVPPKLRKACTVIIGAPTGEMNFSHNYIMSAFARFEMFSPILGTPQAKKPVKGTLLVKRSTKKRKLSSDHSSSDDSPIEEKKNVKSPQKLAKRQCIRRSNRVSSLEKTPDKHNKTYVDNSPNTRSKLKMSRTICNAESPPFYGFDVKLKKKPYDPSVTNNNVISDDVLRRKLQEESDLLFAKKLQEEINKGRYSTRSSIIQTSFCKRRSRQVTLDEIISPRSTVK